MRPLTASVGQVSLFMGGFWILAALFGGKAGAALFELTPPLLMWVAVVLSFIILRLLLRRDRSLLLVLAIEAALTGGMLWFIEAVYHVGNPLIHGLYGIGLIGVMLLQLRWQVKRLGDNTLVFQLQLLLLIALCQIWLAGELEIGSNWLGFIFGTVAVVLWGLLLSKSSGLRKAEDPDQSRPSGLGGMGLGLVAAAGCGTVLIGAAVFTQPIGKAVAASYDYVKGGFMWLMTGIAKVLGFLFTRNQVRLDEGAASGTGESGAGAGELAAETAGDSNLFRTMFHVIVIGLVILLAVSLIRLLLNITVGAYQSAGNKRKRRLEQDGNLWERLAAAFGRMQQRVRSWWILRRHPDSIEALLVWL